MRRETQILTPASVSSQLGRDEVLGGDGNHFGEQEDSEREDSCEGGMEETEGGLDKTETEEEEVDRLDVSPEKGPSKGPSGGVFARREGKH